MASETSDYAWLIGDEAGEWLARLADDERSELQQLEALRRELSAERARLIVEQVGLRRRAAEKFGGSAAAMFFTRVLLEQATDRWIGAYKAERFASAGMTTFGDYCCGIGGDLMGLSERGPATGWDRSDVACLLAGANTSRRATVQCADVESLSPDVGSAWHLDPDRRPNGRRTTAVDDYTPGPALVDAWRDVNSCGAVKLAPAAEAPERWAAEAELEWITRDRECRQQVAWFGALATARGMRRATVVGRSGACATLVGDGTASCEPVEEPSAYIYDPDPSVLAAGLLGSLAEKYGFCSLAAGGSYLTGAERVNDSLVTGFAVRDCLPLRAATVAKYLAERNVGRVEIKKRGVAVEPEALRRHLKLRGDQAATLILTRVGLREVAIVVERVSE